MHIDKTEICSMFVLMMQGHPLSATLPEDSDLGDRFWYWLGASGQRYIHSIYRPDACPPVPGAVFVAVRTWGGARRAMAVGRFSAEGKIHDHSLLCAHPGEIEIHVHLLTRDEDGAKRVLRDLQAVANPTSQPPAELRQYAKPVQLDLLAA